MTSVKGVIDDMTLGFGLTSIDLPVFSYLTMDDGYYDLWMDDSTRG